MMNNMCNFLPKLLIAAIILSVFTCGREVDPQKQAELDMKLIEAIQFRDLNRVDSLLAEGADPNAQDVEGTSALLYAVNVGGLKLNQLLIDRGADVNAKRKTSYRSTALMEAAGRNNVALAKLLIENGADIHIRDTFGDPAINWAAYYGHIEYADLLLENGASWDVESKHGTALEVAMKQWNDHLVAYFLEKGAGEEIENKELIQAFREDEDEKLLQMLNEENIDAKDELGTPLIILAASEGNADIVEALIEKNADLDAMNRVGQTALSRAAYFGHEKIVTQLIEAGASVDLAGEKYKLSPLISASNGGHAGIVRQLVEAGASIDEQDVMNGFTPLMFAVAYNHPEVVKELIKAKANPYIKTEDGAGLFDLLGYTNNPEIGALLESYVTEE
jgi:ankyrin repeat protein